MTVELRPAEDAEKRARDVLTHGEWGSRLTVPQYQQREHRLRDQAWAKREMVTWFLTENGRVLASCETFRNDSSVGAVAGSTWAVATVFTEPALRGQGHAGQLMSLLVERLRREPGAQATVLFSDVGAPIYEKSGYRTFPGLDWVLPPRANAPSTVEWLDEPVAPRRRTGRDGELVLHPGASQLDWHFERSRIYAHFLSRPEVQHRGARTAEASAWWNADYKADELLVLWLEAESLEAARPVLEAAQAQARHAGLKSVRLWETLSLQGFPDAQRLPRDGELPMVADLGARVSSWNRVERALWV